VRNYVTHTLIIKFIRFDFCSWVTLHYMWCDSRCFSERGK
jgi:hypothetical protein